MLRLCTGAVAFLQLQPLALGALRLRGEAENDTKPGNRTACSAALARLDDYMETQIAKRDAWGFWETDAGFDLFAPVVNIVDQAANALGFSVLSNAMPGDERNPEWQALSRSDCPGMEENLYDTTWGLVSDTYARHVAKQNIRDGVHTMPMFVYAYWPIGTDDAKTRKGIGPFANQSSDVVQRTVWGQDELPHWLHTMLEAGSSNGSVVQLQLDVHSIGPQDVKELFHRVASSHNMSYNYTRQAVLLPLTTTITTTGTTVV